MSKRYLFLFLFALSVVYSCRKSPTPSELQGTWREEGSISTKLIFEGDLLYFFHDSGVDSLTFSVDEKHSTLWTAPLDSSSGGKSYQMEYHKKKKILVMMGLFPSAFGNKSKSYFKKD